MKIKQTSYKTTNTYRTLNTLSDKTINIWIVLHGIGYLSKYFIRYFDELNKDENYIIAPQAPSKYYLKDEYKYVGASWLTKEDTVLETKNVLAYLDAIFAAESLYTSKNLILFGFSQGVSIAARWFVSRKINCKHLILYAGSLPKELTSKDFSFIDYKQTKITFVVGNKDPYLTANVLKSETERITQLFQENAAIHIFDGKHEVKKAIINRL